MVMVTMTGAMMVDGSDCPFGAKIAHNGQSVGVDTKKRQKSLGIKDILNYIYI